MTTATERLTAHQDRIRRQIAALSEAVEDYGNKDSLIHYGHVGSAYHVSELLAEALSFITGAGEDLDSDLQPLS